METWRFKLLYDGECPICVREAMWLARKSKDGALALEDISLPDFDPSKYGRSQQELMGVLHGVFPDGRILSRIAAIREAYRVAGMGWMFAPSEWPLVGRIYDLGYAIFARYRVPLGRLMGRKCDDGKCAVRVSKPS